MVFEKRKVDNICRTSFGHNAHLCRRECLKCRVSLSLSLSLPPLSLSLIYIYILYIWGASFYKDVPMVEFRYFVFTRMPGES